MRQVNAEIMRPQLCSDAEIGAFCCFIRQGGEVDIAGLEGRVRQAKALVFLYVDRTLVGVAALKQPGKNYRDKVFKAAGVSDNSATFGLELGWVFVRPEHRGKHYSLVVSSAAIGQADGAPIFATTRTDNVNMNGTLEYLVFKKVGITWSSIDGEHKLVLYVLKPIKRTLADANAQRRSVAGHTRS